VSEGLSLTGDEPLPAIRTAVRPVKRSFAIAGHRTSVSLEGAFWDALREVALEEGVPLARLVARIDAARAGSGLSGAIRVYLLAHYQAKAARSGADRP
jgi:predicted DNA-binding ribbon-helix-helix protein